MGNRQLNHNPITYRNRSLARRIAVLSGAGADLQRNWLNFTMTQKLLLDVTKSTKFEDLCVEPSPVCY
jgi:hypothetical protein